MLPGVVVEPEHAGSRLAQPDRCQLVQQVGVVGQREPVLTQQQVKRGREPPDRCRGETPLLHHDTASAEPLSESYRLPRVEPDRRGVAACRLKGDRLHVGQLDRALTGAREHRESAWQTVSTVRSFLSPRSSPTT